MNKYYLLKLYNGRNTVINECEGLSKEGAINLFRKVHPEFFLDENGYSRCPGDDYGLHITYCVAGHFNNK